MLRGQTSEASSTNRCSSRLKLTRLRGLSLMSRAGLSSPAESLSSADSGPAGSLATCVSCCALLAGLQSFRLSSQLMLSGKSARLSTPGATAYHVSNTKGYYTRQDLHPQLLEATCTCQKQVVWCSRIHTCCGQVAQ